ncbi:hypothetical protein NFI96_023418, partial [Prochilodus magdalenae]
MEWFSKITPFFFKGQMLERQRVEQQLRQIQREQRETEWELEVMKREMGRMKKEKRILEKRRLREIERQKEKEDRERAQWKKRTEWERVNMEERQELEMLRELDRQLRLSKLRERETKRMERIRSNTEEIQRFQKEVEELEQELEALREAILEKELSKADVERESLILLKQIQEDRKMNDLKWRKRDKTLKTSLEKRKQDRQKEIEKMEERKKEELKRKQERIEELQQVCKKIEAQMELEKKAAQETETGILEEMERKREDERQEMERQKYMEKEFQKQLKEREMEKQKQNRLYREQVKRQRRAEERVREMENQMKEECKLAVKRTENWRELMKKKAEEWNWKYLSMERKTEDEIADKVKVQETERQIFAERESKAKTENKNQKKEKERAAQLRRQKEMKLPECFQILAEEKLKDEEEMGKPDMEVKQEASLNKEVEKESRHMEKQFEESKKEMKEELEDRKNEMERERDMVVEKIKEKEEHLRDLADVKEEIEMKEDIIQLKERFREIKEEAKEQKDGEGQTKRTRENEMPKVTEKQREMKEEQKEELLQERLSHREDQQKEEFPQETVNQREEDPQKECGEGQLEIQKIRQAREEHMGREKHRKREMLKMFARGVNFFRTEEGTRRNGFGGRGRKQGLSDEKREESTDLENKQEMLQQMSWPLSPNGGDQLISVKPLHPCPDPAEETKDSPSPVDRSPPPSTDNSAEEQKSSTGPEEGNPEPQAEPQVQTKSYADGSKDKLSTNVETTQEFVLQPPPMGPEVKCSIERDRSSEHGPSYYLLQEKDGTKARHPDKYTEYIRVKEETRTAPRTPAKPATTQPIDELLQKSKKFDKNSPKATAITAKVMEFIALDDQPFSVVEDVGFRRLLEHLEPRYTIPSRRYFSDVALPELHSLVATRVHKLINDNVTAISLTTDIWTS